ncbi:unnamed protein product [Brassica rapa subsp. narinosa]
MNDLRGIRVLISRKDCVLELSSCTQKAKTPHSTSQSCSS